MPSFRLKLRRRFARLYRRQTPLPPLAIRPDAQISISEAGTAEHLRHLQDREAEVAEMLRPRRSEKPNAWWNTMRKVQAHGYREYGHSKYRDVSVWEEADEEPEKESGEESRETAMGYAMDSA